MNWSSDLVHGLSPSYDHDHMLNSVAILAQDSLRALVWLAWLQRLDFSSASQMATLAVQSHQSILRTFSRVATESEIALYRHTRGAAAKTQMRENIVKKTPLQ